jgi:hypothetical protein
MLIVSRQSDMQSTRQMRVRFEPWLAEVPKYLFKN